MVEEVKRRASINGDSERVSVSQVGSRVNKKMAFDSFTSFLRVIIRRGRMQSLKSRGTVALKFRSDFTPPSMSGHDKI